MKVGEYLLIHFINLPADKIIYPPLTKEKMLAVDPSVDREESCKASYYFDFGNWKGDAAEAVIMLA